ncbi:diguanylate cyclase (GGDEF) domain-containing protein [Klenkia soli]|uniref:Diguanylate cyclase (GGDEF) domain-containing protein n=1 Tax=Klenkia soli TaxID=1052260 RepID=A0A1H0QHJ1_9ACTN|nr:bifunctional diguanylate cyclase/phosphodiesterase [Klenkia soli]SDP16209.1 diguanylate cyclase (GGDEF) domain-containing protein [Klenkia soli]
MTRPAVDHRSVVVVLQGVALLALASVAGAHLLHAGPVVDVVPLPWWVLAVAFAATEACVLHVQTAREARTVSVSELPLVLGLFFASPVDLLLGRLLGSAAVFTWQRRSPLKTGWNLALISAQTALTTTVFHLLADLAPGHAPLAWLGAFAGAFAAHALGSVALAAVIAVYERDLDLRGLLRDIAVGDPTAPVVVTVALVVATSLQASVITAWLLVPALVALLLGYRAYASLTERHLAVERLLRFTQAVSDSPETDQVLGRVLGEARELLHAERSEAVFVGAREGVAAHVRLGTSGRLTRSEEDLDVDAWIVDRVVGDGQKLLLARGTRDPEERAWLQARAAREAVVVPLRGGTGVLGALVVLDRLGDVRTFDDSDVALAENVAAQAGVALQNGELVDQLRHDALHDALTGLPNRAQLQRRLVAALERVGDGRSPGAAVMILDLNGFKEVNDALGHQQGDKLLAVVGQRLTDAAGTAALVTRLGGDEFAVLAEDLGDEDTVVRLGRRLLRALEHPVPLDGMEVEVTGSLGIALAPTHAAEPTGLLKRADLAVHDAKASTRGLRVFDPSLTAEDPRRLALVTELRTAVHEGQLEVHVQPQAEVLTGRVVSVEALVRWTHPQLGRVGPDEFIPVAERSGLIGPLTTLVLDRSLAAVAAWRAAGTDLSVAVNLSTRSLHDTDLVDEVARLLRRHDVPSDRLTLEVTEGSVMADPARTIAVLHQLRDLGCRLSVDDFGTGYSSLSYLKRLPVQEVKIDQSFVTGLRSGGEDVAIVRAIVDLGRHLGLAVVAEGVEDQETWDLLADTGCDLVQGWHLGRPMPTADLPGWLGDRARSTPARPLRAV